MLLEQETTGKIIGAAIEVHRHLGPGLLESVYEECMVQELIETGLQVDRQVELPIIYKGKKLKNSFRIDLLIDDLVIVELKSVQQIEKIHEAQLLTYMRMAKKKVGLLMNFNVSIMKQGIRRFIND